LANVRAEGSNWQCWATAPEAAAQTQKTRRSRSRAGHGARMSGLLADAMQTQE